MPDSITIKSHFTNEISTRIAWNRKFHLLEMVGEEDEEEKERRKIKPQFMRFAAELFMLLGGWRCEPAELNEIKSIARAFLSSTLEYGKCYFMLIHSIFYRKMLTEVRLESNKMQIRKLFAIYSDTRCFSPREHETLIMRLCDQRRSASGDEGN